METRAGRRRRARRGRGFRWWRASAAAGVLKPDVVFFGENVPRERVDSAFALVELAAETAPARRGLVAHGDVRAALRPGRAPARGPGRDRQPGPDARRRPGDGARRPRLLETLNGARRPQPPDVGRGRRAAAREADRRPRAARGRRPAAAGPRRRRPDAPPSTTSAARSAGPVRTRSELDALTRDLPDPVTPPATSPSTDPRARPGACPVPADRTAHGGPSSAPRRSASPCSAPV